MTSGPEQTVVANVHGGRAYQADRNQNDNRVRIVATPSQLNVLFGEITVGYLIGTHITEVFDAHGFSLLVQTTEWLAGARPLINHQAP
jgi:hypothetical protein